MDRENIPGGTQWEAAAGYSRAVRIGHLVHVAGTTATAEDGSIVGVGDVETQMRQTLDNIDRALGKAGSCLENVVRTRMYVTNIDEWETISRIHGEYFDKIRPASTLVEVSRLVNADMLVEIEVDAVIGG